MSNNEKSLEVVLVANKEIIESSVAKIEILSKQIKEGELSKTLLVDIARELANVAKVFDKHESLMSISPIIIALEKFLEIINLSFSPEKPHRSIEYLAMILDDINENISDIFITRSYSDVYVFEDSLVSNITYMTNALLGKESVKEEVEEAQLELF